MRIIFIHNKTMHYRIPFFRGFAELYDVVFLFTHAENIQGLEGVKYKKLGNYFGIAFGLIPWLITKTYDIVILPPVLDSLPEFIEAVFCFIIVKLRRKLCILWTVKWDFPNEPLKVRIVELLAVKFIIRYCHAFIVPGTKSKKYLRDLGANPNKIFIAPNASTVEKEKVNIREKLNLQDKKVILYLSRIVPCKGLDYLIRAFSELEKERDDVFLLIGGDGKFTDECRKLRVDLNLKNIYFAGAIEHEDVGPYFLAANVFVLPGVSRNGIAESWGLVLNEAMSVGKPVVSTTAVGAAYDLIKPGVNGFMVTEKDADALYGAIKRIITYPKLEEKMGIESERIIREGYTYKNMVNGFKEAVAYAVGHYII